MDTANISSLLKVPGKIEVVFALAWMQPFRLFCVYLMVSPFMLFHLIKYAYGISYSAETKIDIIPSFFFFGCCILQPIIVLQEYLFFLL